MLKELGCLWTVVFIFSNRCFGTNLMCCWLDAQLQMLNCTNGSDSITDDYYSYNKFYQNHHQTNASKASVSNTSISAYQMGFKDAEKILWEKWSRNKTTPAAAESSSMFLKICSSFHGSNEQDNVTTEAATNRFFPCISNGQLEIPSAATNNCTIVAVPRLTFACSNCSRTDNFTCGLQPRLDESAFLYLRCQTNTEYCRLICKHNFSSLSVNEFLNALWSNTNPSIVNSKGNHHCQISPCLNGGTCKTEADAKGYHCICPFTWAGTHCEHSLHSGGPASCNPNPCGAEARCFEDNGEIECVPEHSKGFLPKCSKLKCFNGGECLIVKSREVCYCGRNFAGGRCEDPLTYLEYSFERHSQRHVFVILATIATSMLLIVVIAALCQCQRCNDCQLLLHRRRHYQQYREDNNDCELCITTALSRKPPSSYSVENFNVLPALRGQCTTTDAISITPSSSTQFHGCQMPVTRIV